MKRLNLDANNKPVMGDAGKGKLVENEWKLWDFRLWRKMWKLQVYV